MQYSTIQYNMCVSEDCDNNVIQYNIVCNVMQYSTIQYNMCVSEDCDSYVM